MLHAFFWVIPPASEFYLPTFRNTLFHLHRRIGIHTHLHRRIGIYTYPHMKMEQTECSETSAYKIQTLGNYPEESIQHNGSCYTSVTYPTIRELFTACIKSSLVVPYIVHSSKPLEDAERKRIFF
jgi:hypothetical protein